MNVSQRAKDVFRELMQTDDEALLQALVERTDLVRIPKGTVLIRENEAIKDCYCLLQGIIRISYQLAGEEITEALREEQGTIIYPSVFVTGRDDPANGTVDTLTDCELLHMKADDLAQIMCDFPDFYKIQLRLVLQFVYRSFKLKRYMTHLNPTQRYLWFVENRPSLAEKVPQKYIASFLGMTPVSLSRIRSKIKGKDAGKE